MHWHIACSWNHTYECIVESTKSRLHILFKALCKPVYVKSISCKCTKAVYKLIRPNHILRWFGTGLKWFRSACIQLKRFKLLYKIHGVELLRLLFSKQSPSPIASKPKSSHVDTSPTTSKHVAEMQVAMLWLARWSISIFSYLGSGMYFLHKFLPGN